MFSFSNKTATVYVGRIILLFGYKIYERDYQDAIQLLRDVLFSPYAVVERIILEIKDDKDKKLLQELLSEFSSEFAERIRES